MTSSQTILENLKNLNQYLAQFHQSQQSTYFEQLIAEAFSHILYLPFYTSDNDDATIPHRVAWQGSINFLSKAPPGGPDAIACCYNFHLIIEATTNTGANQWAREFAPSIRHCEDFCSHTGIQPRSVYVLMICSDLHRDTYRSIKSNPTQEYKLIPLKVSELSRILETSILAFTMRHLELRRFLNQIPECIRNSSSLDGFRSAVDDLLTNWQKDILKVEKSAVIGVKSYKAMRKINRTHIGTSEILQSLQGDQTINEYFKTIGDKLSVDIIEESLIQQSLASQLSPTYEDEKIFYPVPFTDFRERTLRLIKAMENINE